MSQYYMMSVEITGHNFTYTKNITEAADCLWDFDDWYEGPTGNLSASGNANLSGCVEDFVEYLSRDIWEANCGYCKVSVQATYLEDLPFESFEPNESDYERYLEDKSKDT